MLGLAEKHEIWTIRGQRMNTCGNKQTTSLVKTSKQEEKEVFELGAVCLPATDNQQRSLKTYYKGIKGTETLERKHKLKSD